MTSIKEAFQTIIGNIETMENMEGDLENIMN